MNKNSPVLRLDKVYKSFGGLQALSNLDMSVEREEMVGLIGPNGAGKSTVFNIITSIYRPERGDVYFLGQKITGLAPHRICHLGISRTYQLVKTFLKMTVLENAMVASVYGPGRQGKDGAKERALETLNLVQLSDKKNIMASHLTLSDRRLLEIAMGLSSMPVLTLLDEPMAGLTSVEIRKLMQIIERTRKERKLSIVWIEHRVDAILEYCDRVVVLDHGEKIADSVPHEIANNSRVMEAYLGEPIA